MLASFCLRLACSMAAALVVLSPAQINPRFYRVQFLTVLGLTALAAYVLRDATGAWLLLILALAMLTAFLGSIVWSLDKAPGGKTLVVVTAGAMVVALAAGTLALAVERQTEEVSEPVNPVWQLTGELTS